MRPLFSLLLLASVCLAADVPLVTAPQLARTATGDLDWAFAPQVTGFRLAPSGALASQQALVQVSYDDRELHVLFRCPVSDVAKLTGEVRPRDGAVWYDDAVELFLGTRQDGKGFYQLIANTKGSRYDAKDNDPAWDGDWTCDERAETGLLMVLSNLGKDEVAGSVALDLEAMGFPAEALVARDALTGEAVAMAAGEVRTTLAPMGWRLVRVGRQ